jgi:hypothetical protein
MGLTVNAISELILLLLMTVAVIFAYRKLTQLDVNSHPISLLDDLLLFICIPAFFLYGIFCIVPAILKNNGLSIAITLLQVRDDLSELRPAVLPLAYYFRRYHSMLNPLCLYIFVLFKYILLIPYVKNRQLKTMRKNAILYYFKIHPAISVAG